MLMLHEIVVPFLQATELTRIVDNPVDAVAPVGSIGVILLFVKWMREDQKKALERMEKELDRRELNDRVNEKYVDSLNATIKIFQEFNKRVG